MPRWVVFDQFIVTVRVPTDLPGPAVASVRRALDSRSLRVRLRRAVWAAVRADPGTAAVQVRVGR